MTNRKTKSIIILIMTIVVVFVAFKSVSYFHQLPASDTGNKTKTVILYFADEKSQVLVSEERNVSRVTVDILVNELIKGPIESNNSKTLPDDVKLIDYSVEDGLAVLNFSNEMIKNHAGGSLGEWLTIYSIVNTLIVNPETEINRVLFQIDGKGIDTLAGHIDLSLPVEGTI